MEVFFRQVNQKLALNKCQIRSAVGIQRFWTLMSLAYLIWWSREAAPYHIPVTGFRHPLREPDLHLSMYPALLLFVHWKFKGDESHSGTSCTLRASYDASQSWQFPTVVYLSGF